PPPRSTLFPYTTLFRSSRTFRAGRIVVSVSRRRFGLLLLLPPFTLPLLCLLARRFLDHLLDGAHSIRPLLPEALVVDPLDELRRSEEHTSELQSRGHLV